jgi:hypothetical protein
MSSIMWKKSLIQPDQITLKDKPNYEIEYFKSKLEK